MAGPGRILLTVTAVLAALACGCASLEGSMDTVRTGKDPEARRYAILDLGERVAGGGTGERDPAVAAGVRTVIEGALKDPHPLVRAEAVRVCVRGWGVETVPVILPLLGDKEKIVRHTVVQALRDLASPRAVEPLIARLAGERESEIRVEVIRALESIGDERAAGALIKALDDEDPAVGFFAEEALGTLTGECFGHNRGKWKAWWETGASE